jgi:hypothetical protein
LRAHLHTTAAAAGSSSSSGLLVEDQRLMDPRVYATVVRGVLDYMRRDMTHPEGGLYSAEVREGTDVTAAAPAAEDVDDVLLLLQLLW